MEEIPYLQQTLHPDDASVKKFILLIRPSWAEKDVCIKPVVGGNINYMWTCYNINNKDEVIAVKLYGELVSKLLNLDAKIQNDLTVALYREGICSSVYSTVTNGIAYEYIPGCNLLPYQVLDKTISRKVIAQMHQIHRIEPPGMFDRYENMMPRFCKEWKKQISSNNYNSDRYREHFTSVEDSTKILDQMHQIYNELKNDFPACFCHCDMHTLNVVYDEKTGDLSPVDWDLSGYAPEPYDPACYLSVDPDNAAHDSGINIFDQPEYIRWFVTEYLQTHPKYKSTEITDEMITKWMIGVYKAMFVRCSFSNLVPQFLWNNDPSDDFFLVHAKYHYNRAHLCKKMYVEMSSQDVQK